MTTTAAAARRESGLPEVAALREPHRTALTRRLVETAGRSPVLAGLVDLARQVAGTSCAQLSLLAEEQVAVVLRTPPALRVPDRLALEDGLCSITLLSRDVLVAADAARHPWLGDLLPVTAGVVGAYLGVPLVLPDGSPVGALCVWETAPHSWSDRDVGLTCAVADLVVAELARLAEA